MKKILFSEKPKFEFKKREPKGRLEFISFAADQFKRITKKNLKIPITLYHL
ncbi:MAG: hypothetical protein NZM02_00540 [Patescibacteria group bacterium]|nr:hypothetical protein [Patescibacteria group bacterium]